MKNDYLEKRIKIGENRVLIYSVTEGFIKPTYTVTEGFVKNGEVEKSYILSQWDDYGFNGWSARQDNLHKINFQFDSNHPLYMPLFHLLNYDDSLIIEDDHTACNGVRYLHLFRVNNLMMMNFIDNSRVDEFTDVTKRFDVFIKNILPDGRSKIDHEYKDTKKRLAAFFNELNDVFTNEYHQVTFEEQGLMHANNDDIKELKKVFQKDYSDKCKN